MAGTRESGATPALEDLHQADAPSTRAPSPESASPKAKKKPAEPAEIRRMKEEFQKKLEKLGRQLVKGAGGKREEKEVQEVEEGAQPKFFRPDLS